MTDKKEFMDVYRYCAKALKKTYELNVSEYSYELYLSYLSAKKSHDPLKKPAVSLPLWVFWYLKGRIKDARLSENKKLKQKLHTKGAEYIDEEGIELNEILGKYDNTGILHDHYIKGESLRDLATLKKLTVSSIHKLKNHNLEKVKMNIDLQEYYDALGAPAHNPYIALVKTSGELLRHILKCKKTQYLDTKEMLRDVGIILFNVVSILKVYQLPIDVIHTKTMDVVEDILYLVCHANKIVEGADTNSTRHALYNIVGLLDSIANRSGSSLKELGFVKGA